MFPVVTEQGSVLRASVLLTQPIPLGSALSWPVVDAPAGDGIASAANAASTAGKGQARRRDGSAGTVVIAGMNRHAPTDPSVAAMLFQVASARQDPGEYLRCRPSAPWRSGYAAACKAAYTGSIPVGASRRASCGRGLKADGRVTYSRPTGMRGTRLWAATVGAVTALAIAPP